GVATHQLSGHIGRRARPAALRRGLHGRRADIPLAPRRSSLSGAPQEGWIGRVTTADALEKARLAFDKQAWKEAYSFFSAADRSTRLEADQLVQFSQVAHLLGE